MPKLKNRVPKYSRHKASGQAVVTIGGKDIYLGRHGSAASRREYDRLIGEWLQRDRRPVCETPTGTTVIEVVAAYWRYVEKTYDAKTQDFIRRALGFVKRLYADKLAADFGPLALKAVRQQMLDDEANYARSYVNQHVARIKRCFKWAAAEELVPPSVPQALAMVAGLRKGKSSARETGPVLPVEDAIVDQTLPKLPQVVADMVRLQRITGMRPAEVCQVRPCDIDRSDADVWVYTPATHKTEYRDRNREVYFGPQAQSVLLKYLARDAKAFCFSPRDSEAKRRAELSANRKTPDSCGNRPGTNRKQRPKKSPGDKYTTASYRRAIHAACVKADIGTWSPNQLRHTAATEIRRKFGLEGAQVVLGHAKADVTQVYAEMDRARGIEIAKAIG